MKDRRNHGGCFLVCIGSVTGAKQNGVCVSVVLVFGCVFTWFESITGFWFEEPEEAAEKSAEVDTPPSVHTAADTDTPPAEKKEVEADTAPCWSWMM